MDRSTLQALLGLPATHDKLVGDFEGPYSVGVGRDGSGQTIIILNLAEPGRDEERRVELGGETFTVHVHREFRRPTPLVLRAAIK